MRTGNTIKKFLLSFLVTYGLNAKITNYIVLGAYQDKYDFFTDSIYAVIGKYDFVFLFEWLLIAIALIYLENRTETENKISLGLISVLFSVILSIGQVLETFNGLLVLGSISNAVIILLKICGLAILIYQLLAYVTYILNDSRIVSYPEGFFTKKPWLKSFAILMVAYLPVVLLSYPGNLCFDTIGEILQVLGERSYSTHHPLVATLLMGGCVKLGDMLFASQKIGLFVYIIIQMVMLSAALAYTISVLAGKGVKAKILWLLQIIYIISPIYSNIVSTAIKDVPFISCFIAYIVCLAIFLNDTNAIKNFGFDITFVLVGMGTCLFRNNGLIEVLLSGVIVFFVLLAKKYDYSKDVRIRWLVYGFILPVGLSVVINSALAACLHAEKGSKGEMLSLPFQVTARYLTEYEGDLTAGQKASIEAVLGDIETIKNAYDPDLSDSVKALFSQDSSTKEVISYLLTDVGLFFKHPRVCIDAILVHIYGWYTPTISTATRYEIHEVSDLGQMAYPESMAVIRKLLIFGYRFADRLSLLGVLQNVGFATWIMIYFSWYRRKNDRRGSILGAVYVPLWIALLICFAAPGFYLHTRYGFPILFTVPFISVFILLETKKDA